MKLLAFVWFMRSLQIGVCTQPGVAGVKSNLTL